MSFSKKTIAAVMLSFPLIASAASLTNIQNAQTDVTFSTPNQFTHNINPVKNLTSGTFAQPTAIANGSVNTTGTGLKARYAIMFPVTASIPTAGTAGVLVKGKNDPNNTISVSLQKDASMTGAFVAEQVNGASWLVYDREVDVLKYDVTVNGIVKADTYPVSVAAAVYTK
ncbi:hypothetical protein [Serratia fonticola]